MGSAVNLQLVNFKKLKRRLDSRSFRRRLRRNVRVMGKRIGLLAEAAIIEGLHRGQGGFKANKPSTAAIKGSSRVLVDSGQLAGSVNSKMENWYTVAIGVLKNRSVVDEQTGKQVDVKKIAAILYYGATIRVTAKMRRFFAAMHRQFPDKWKPLSPDTRVIVIPARPYLRLAMQPKMVRQYVKRWNEAIDLTLQGVTL